VKFSAGPTSGPRCVSRRFRLFFTLDVDRLPSFLDTTPECIARLRSRFCPPLLSAAPRRSKKDPINYAALQQTYARMLAEGGFASQADLARHLGVSRVWVSRVLIGAKRRDSHSH
jgi:hypothetical protein